MIYRASVKGQMKKKLVSSTSSQIPLAQFSTVSKRGLTQLHKLKLETMTDLEKFPSSPEMQFTPKQLKAHTFVEALIPDTNVVIAVCKGDITTENTDAIVCPASSFL